MLPSSPFQEKSPYMTDFFILSIADCDHIEAILFERLSFSSRHSLYSNQMTQKKLKSDGMHVEKRLP